MIDRLGEDGLIEVLERNENTIFKEIALVKRCQNELKWAKQDQDLVRWCQIEQNGIQPD